MSDEDKSQKTEEPTEKKLSDQRKKGNVPSSKEVGTTVSVFVLMLIVVFIAPSVIPNMAGVMQAHLSKVATTDVGTSVQGIRDVTGVIHALYMPVLTIVAPVFVLMVFAAVAGVLIQGETVVALERIKPKASNISPLGGLKKIVGFDNFVEFLKSVTKVFVVAIIGFLVIRGTITSVWQGVGFVPETLLERVQSKAGLILIIVTALLVPVAIFDIFFKRAQWIKKNRMSMKEIRDEHKDQEGDPQVKAKQDEMRRSKSRKRMMEEVPNSTVVLTNPTHYAVALKYEMGVDLAPRCVAKGADVLAKKIRESAKENEVPIVENKPLARALHASVEIEDQVPAEHWAAVAEIVSFVLDIQNNIRRRPPEGSELRTD